MSAGTTQTLRAFFRMIPNGTLAFKHDKRKGTKKGERSYNCPRDSINDGGEKDTFYNWQIRQAPML